MTKFEGTTAKIIVGLFCGAIIVSFAFTGFDGFSSSGDSVAMVDKTPITISEYRRALRFETDRFSKIFGGKALSNKQIRQFRIKENVIQQLIQQKVMGNYASSFKFGASKSEIKESIKKSEYFLTNKKFDVNKYKAILQQNSFTPAKYEEIKAEEIKMRNFSGILAGLTLSKKSISDIASFKSNVAEVYGVSFDKESNTKFLKVSDKEVSEVLKKTELISSLYKTQYPKGSKKIGDVSRDIAKAHAQKTKRKELTAFNAKLKKEVAKLLENGKISALKKLVKKHNMIFENKAQVNSFDLALGKIQIKEGLLNSMMMAKSKALIQDESATKISFVKPIAFKIVKANVKDSEKNSKEASSTYARQLSDEVLKFETAKAKVVTFPSLL